MDGFYQWLGPKKSHKIRLAVMDMWKPFRNSLTRNAPQARVIFDKFHIMRHLGDALDEVRRSEYRCLAAKDRAFIKGQRYTLLSHRENLSLDGRRSLDKLLKANKRLNTAYLLKESFGQLWGLPDRGLGSRLLRVLEAEPQMAAAHALREVRGDDRPTLGGHRVVLPP